MVITGLVYNAPKTDVKTLAIRWWKGASMQRTIVASGDNLSLSGPSNNHSANASALSRVVARLMTLCPGGNISCTADY